MQRISKSVGKGGKNEQADVRVVQELLNKFTKVGGYHKLAVTGQADDKLFSAIGAFQEKVLKLPRPDKLIEPGKNTIKKLNENPSSVEKEAKKNENGAAGGGGKGKVSGKSSGVNKDILSFLQAVADHYGKEIKIVSGLRDKKGQANAMWDNWNGTLERGQLYPTLRGKPKLLKQLDDWWATAHENKSASSADKASAEKEFKKAIEKIASDLSLHLVGRAVDIDMGVDKNVFSVLKTHMYFLPEPRKGPTRCYHFDDSRGKVPNVTDAVKAKWPTK
jgi:hypothetical protein